MLIKGRPLALVLATGVFAAGLYFLPLKKQEYNKLTTNPNSSFNERLNLLKEALSPKDKALINNLEKALEGTKTSHVPLLDSLGKTWDRIGQPYASSHYFEEIASKQPGEKNYLNAAYRYFDAFKSLKDSTEKGEMVKRAIYCYSKVLELNPENLDAKTDLGVLYAEGTQEPMKGIMMLREVVTQKPEHENAQLNLGLLSLKSHQYDKAIDRFQKVTEINPQNFNAWILLSNTYLQTGNKDKAIENFQKLKKYSADKELLKEVDKYIAEIKRN